MIKTYLLASLFLLAPTLANAQTRVCDVYAVWGSFQKLWADSAQVTPVWTRDTTIKEYKLTVFVNGTPSTFTTNKFHHPIRFKRQFDRDTVVVVVQASGCFQTAAIGQILVPREPNHGKKEKAQEEEKVEESHS